MAHGLAATDLLADLTDDQRAAVTHGEGPLLILAGAGSGKTRVITRRVAYLLQQGVKPWNILAITFTNKAATEMRSRVEELAPGNSVWICTFHSLGARLLRQYADRLNIDKNFTIYDTDDRARLVREAMAALDLPEKKFTPEQLASAISKAKNKLLTPGQFERTATNYFEQIAAQVYLGYEKRLRAANGMDFDDLLYLPAMALKTNEEFRRDLDAKFRYILIDEYQDTNLAQYSIARQLAMDHPNLCVVGDPDQCLLPGTLVATPQGNKPIEQMKEGDELITGIGWGRTRPMPIDKVMVNPFKGRVVRVELEGGVVLRATPNHICFSRIEADPNLHHVYLMWKRGVGYRLGTTSRKNHDDAMALASDIGRLDDFSLISRIRLLPSKAFHFTPAGNLRRGMTVPIHVEGRVEERKILSITSEEYEGPVYDLSVPHTHNFVANGMFVHNSIYRWRGSDIKNILDFERDYPDARTITLSKNYRSTPGILDAASTLIANNKQRKKKRLITDNGQGEPVRIIAFNDGLEEAESVVLRIKEAAQQGRYRYRDHAIFVRINALTRPIESAFVKHGVPFQIVRGLAFYERKENRDVLAYLRLLVNPKDAVSFLRIVNEPTRGIGKTSLEKLSIYAEKMDISLFAAAEQVAMIPEIKGKAATGLRQFFRLITELRAQLHLPPHELIAKLLDESGYRKMLEGMREEDGTDRLANVEEMITAARQFHEADPTRTLVEFLEQVALASDVDSWDEEADRVSVMTLHASKGLEFPVVYVLAVEQGLLPHQRSLENDEEMEEERRLCFVGMTRAMKELYLCRARIREFRGQAQYTVESPFLRELPANVERLDASMGRNAARTAADDYRKRIDPAAKDWADTGARQPLPAIGAASGLENVLDRGMVVQHEEYGIGTVTEATGYGAMKRVKIRFPSSGEKVFVANKVKLKVVPRRG